MAMVRIQRGMHVSPAKHTYGSVTDGRTDSQTDGRTNRRTERQTTDKVIPMCRLRHVSPAKHSYGSVTDGQTDRQTDRQTDDGQSDPYVSLCFAGDTKIVIGIILSIFL